MSENQKIVVAASHGGFGLSEKGLLRLGELDERWRVDDPFDIPRDNPALVQVVEEMGKEASDPHAELKVVEIPEGVEWELGYYEGREWVAEKHRRWWPDHRQTTDDFGYHE